MTVRPASTVCALRPGAAGGVEVLMVRRKSRSVFMGGAYVFPGGAVDAVDHSEAAARVISGGDGSDLAWRAAALRELAEEAGVFVTSPPGEGAEAAARLAGLHGENLYAVMAAEGVRFDAAALAYLSNWVTPPGPPRRFDTRFYVVSLTRGTEAIADETEVTDATWVTPADALAAGRRGEWALYFPTIKHLELLERFASPDEAAAFAVSQPEVPVVAPSMERRPDGQIEVFMPAGHGFQLGEGGGRE